MERMSRVLTGSPAGRTLLLLGGTVVLGVGVALLLSASLGSDGYSTMVNGISMRTDLEFALVNLLVSVVFVGAAWMRGLRPGVGTVVQIVVVGVTVSLVLDVLGAPDGLATRGLLLALAFPVLALGIAAYLGSQTGAGPVEAAALAYDPPLPFRWSYSVLQGGGAVVGWLLGAAVGPGTLAVIFLLGPVVDLTARALRLEIEQVALTDR